MSDVIGFIGAGQMGEPMVARLLGAGHRLVVYVRRDDVRARLAAAGAEVVDSVAGVARRSDIVISCLFSDAQLRAVGTGVDGFVANAKPGAVFVSHTTGSVATLQELAGSHPSAPAVVDAPVSGTADQIVRGELTVLIGGPGEAVARVTPVLSAYADTIIATGELGTALDLKLINNVLFAANAQLVAAAAELGERLGVDSTALLEALSVCSGGSNASGYVQKVGGVDAFAEIAAPFLRKDVAVALAAAEDAGANLGLLGNVVTDGPLSLIGERSTAP